MYLLIEKEGFPCRTLFSDSENFLSSEKSNSSFDSNTAQVDGGALYWMGANGILLNSSLNNNYADYGGGAVY